jgi:hypothetical protein
MASLPLAQGSLPEAELLAGTVDLLLDQWESPSWCRPDASRSPPSQPEQWLSAGRRCASC